jgi:hypothetical protein
MDGVPMGSLRLFGTGNRSIGSIKTIAGKDNVATIDDANFASDIARRIEISRQSPDCHN